MWKRSMGALVMGGLMLCWSAQARAEDPPPEPLPQFEAGGVLTAAQLNAIVDRVNAITAALAPGTTVVTSEIAPSTAAGKFASVDCPLGINGLKQKLTGGGALVTGFSAGVAINQSGPMDPGPFGWSAQAERNSGGDFDPSFQWGLKVYAICIDTPDIEGPPEPD